MILVCPNCADPDKARVLGRTPTASTANISHHNVYEVLGLQGVWCMGWSQRRRRPLLTQRQVLLGPRHGSRMLTLQYLSPCCLIMCMSLRVHAHDHSPRVCYVFDLDVLMLQRFQPDLVGLGTLVLCSLQQALQWYTRSPSTIF